MPFRPSRSIAALALAALWLLPAAAQTPRKPLIMPMAAPAGPSTWLFGQAYGNTVGAYNFGTQWYSAGQGLHFGVDISMPCGTPLVAAADGEVIYADNLAFGAGPHNLILRHPQLGITTLYGHLLDRPPVREFQPVQQGQIVGYSGDPDVTCDSRPHLHFEVRSLDYRTAYNPVDYIEANWHALAAVGPFNLPMFQQDFANPRRWMSLEDQPPVAFGGARLNAYAFTWPPPPEQRAPASAPPPRPFTPLPASLSGRFRLLSADGCCAVHWWHPAEPDRLYAVDGPAGGPAALLAWDLSAGDAPSPAGSPPPPQFSPDGTHQVIASGGQARIRRLSDGAEWVAPSGGFTPAVSPDSRRLLWQTQAGRFIPGAPPPVEIWISALDGSGVRQVAAGPRLSAAWLDGERLLLAQTERTLTTLTVYQAADGSSFTLGTWDRLRGLSLGPGGGWLLFYQSFQADPAANAVYALATTPGAAPQRLPWFGAWRWRDAESVYYLPFDPASPAQTLAYYHIPTGGDRRLTDPAAYPFLVADGDWSVSADGRKIAFRNAFDRRLWALELEG